MRVSRDIGQYKKEHNMPILQAKRYEDAAGAPRRSRPGSWAWTASSCAPVLQAIHEESIRQQMEVLGK